MIVKSCFYHLLVVKAKEKYFEYSTNMPNVSQESLYKYILLCLYISQEFGFALLTYDVETAKRNR